MSRLSACTDDSRLGVARSLRASAGRLLALNAALFAALAGCAGASLSPDSPDPEAVRLYTRAGLHQQAGRLMDAAEDYDAAARLDPNSVEIWLSSARLRGRLGDWPGARSRAERALALAPSDPRAMQAVGEACFATNDIEGATTHFDALTREHPDVVEGWLGQARLATERGDAEAVLRALEKAVALAPDRAELHIGLGEVHERLQQPAAAAASFDRAVRLDPLRRGLDARIIALALEGGDHDIARAAAQRLAGPNAHPSAGRMALAAMLVRRDDFFAAAEELEAAIRESPEQHEARVMLARVLVHVDRAEQALVTLGAIPLEAASGVEALRLRTALRVDRGEAEPVIAELSALTATAEAPPAVHGLLAAVLRRAERTSEAGARLEAAIARWPGDAELRYALGTVRHELGDEPGALAEMEAAVAADARHAGALNFIGYTWAERGVRLPEAEELIRRALSERPDDPAIIDSLGWVRYRRGDLRGAESALRQAASKAPDDPEIAYHLAEVLQVAGQREAAAALYARALELTRDPAERRRMVRRWSRVVSGPSH